MSLDLRKILTDHLKWLRGEDGGSRANLTDADLTDAGRPGCPGAVGPAAGLGLDAQERLDAKRATRKLWDALRAARSTR